MLKAVSGAQELQGHQEYVEWQGARVLTLAPLWPQPLRAVVVGINPAPKSVAVGHYYQGARGKYALNQLRTIGVLPMPASDAQADDLAVARGIGFTDLVPRPTKSEKDLHREEILQGAERLQADITAHQPRLILAVFQPPVHALLGRKYGQPGEQPARFAGTPVFKLPRKEDGKAHPAWSELGRLWRDMFPDLAQQDAP